MILFESGDQHRERQHVVLTNLIANEKVDKLRGGRVSKFELFSRKPGDLLSKLANEL